MAALLSVRSVWVNRRREEALLDEEKARYVPADLYLLVAAICAQLCMP